MLFRRGKEREKGSHIDAGAARCAGGFRSAESAQQRRHSKLKKAGKKRKKKGTGGKKK